MSADHKTAVWHPLSRLLTKGLFAVALLIGLAAVLQPGSANARTYVSVGVGDGPGWHGGYWGHGPYWRGGYWGPSWGFYGYPAPVYGWAPYDYYAPAPVAYGSNIWPDAASSYHEQAYRQALSAPLGEAVNWTGGGAAGTVTAVRDGHSGDRYCREFQQEVMIDGRRQQAYGAACKMPDGSWQVVPDDP